MNTTSHDTPSSSDLEAVLGELVRQAIRAELPDVGDDVDPVVRPSRFADYQVNGALSLAKRLGRPPREIADPIARRLLSHGDILSTAEVAGPGFINCAFTDDYLNKTMVVQAGDDRLGRPHSVAPRTFVIDYGGPNVAKEMHVAHLRSAAIGDALTRVISTCGDTVVKQNHLGDWGTQFGMLIEHMLEEDSAATGELHVTDLDALYKQARAHFEADDEFKERARNRVVALQAGDKETLRLWEILVTESKRHFDEVFDRLGTLLTTEDYRGESMYNDQLDDTVAELQAKSLVELDQGALCAFPPGFTGSEGERFPLIVRKSDGGYGYGATDLAALRYNVMHDHADVVLYVVDDRQAQHFAMVIAVGRQAGWIDETMQVVHIPFGLVLGKNGKPFKTREGDSSRLIDLIDEAVEKAEQKLQERKSDLSLEEVESIADAVGIGAIKWADLKSDRSQNYVFDIEAMTSFEGNTGPYIQYAATRARSVLRRGGEAPEINSISIAEPAERQLALHLAAYGTAVRRVRQDYEPHHLCTYLYELAGRFSGFYEQCPVLQAPSDEVRRSRLALCHLTTRVIDDGLMLLGIQPLERM